MCSFIFTNKSIDHDNLNLLSSKRGPDHTQICNIDGFNYIHNLLDISGKRIVQPITKNNITLLFNGEIYTPISECDTEIIIPLYKEHGKIFVEFLNGEYAILLLDRNKNKIFLYSDIFATKPLFYSIEYNNIGVSSYSSELKILGFREIKRVRPSTFIEINLKDYSIEEYSHNIFNLKEYKNHYDDCIQAFEDSLKNRCDDKVAVGLSSGHDSGAILQWSLLNKKTDNNFFYVTNNRENIDVMNERFKQCNINNINYYTINYFENKNINDIIHYKKLNKIMEDFEKYKNENATFMLSSLMHTIKKKSIDIFISGQGGDEILSNYYKNNNFFYDLKKQFPWNNFFDGKNRLYVDQLEYVGGCYGIEVRYPFLDKKFIQEFLFLSKDLKNKKYKSVISEYLNINGLSVNKTKVGMGCSYGKKKIENFIYE